MTGLLNLIILPSEKRHLFFGMVLLVYLGHGFFRPVHRSSFVFSPDQFSGEILSSKKKKKMTGRIRKECGATLSWQTSLSLEYMWQRVQR